LDITRITTVVDRILGFCINFVYINHSLGYNKNKINTEPPLVH